MSEPRRKRHAPRVGAFFDMDKTLIAENSGSLYMKYRYERGEVDGWELAKGLYAYLRYKAGILDIRAFTQGAMLEFRGQSERRLFREARDFVRKMVIPTLYPAAIEKIRWHQAQGHVVAIVSGATKFIVRPLAEQLGVRHYLYTRLEVEHGRFTGRVIDPICFEEGKIYWLQQLVDEKGIDLAKSWFYTDSVTDLPLMELVGHPVAVNPDPFLYRTARRRCWPVEFFEPPRQGAEGAAQRAAGERSQ
jgi:HAD superfamily hydrolase (TIGR01490 family)